MKKLLLSLGSVAAVAAPVAAVVACGSNESNQLLSKLKQGTLNVNVPNYLSSSVEQDLDKAYNELGIKVDLIAAPVFKFELNKNTISVVNDASKGKTISDIKKDNKSIKDSEYKYSGKRFVLGTVATGDKALKTGLDFNIGKFNFTVSDAKKETNILTITWGVSSSLDDSKLFDGVTLKLEVKLNNNKVTSVSSLKMFKKDKDKSKQDTEIEQNNNPFLFELLGKVKGIINQSNIEKIINDALK